MKKFRPVKFSRTASQRVPTRKVKTMADPKAPPPPTPDTKPPVPPAVSDSLLALKTSLQAQQKAKADSLAARKAVLDALSAWEGTKDTTMPPEVREVTARRMTGLRGLLRVGQTDLSPWSALLTDLQAAVAALPAFEAVITPIINDVVAIIKQGV